MASLLLYSTTHLHYVGTVTKKTRKKQENLIFYQIFLNNSHLPEINQQAGSCAEGICSSSWKSLSPYQQTGYQSETGRAKHVSSTHKNRLQFQHWHLAV
jgi:hypothetical protein